MTKRRIRQRKYLNDLHEKTYWEGNIYPKGISDEEFVATIIKYFLGDYYLVDPLSPSQANTVLLSEIIFKYKSRIKGED